MGTLCTGASWRPNGGARAVRDVAAPHTIPVSTSSLKPPCMSFSKGRAASGNAAVSSSSQENTASPWPEVASFAFFAAGSDDILPCGPDVETGEQNMQSPIAHHEPLQFVAGSDVARARRDCGLGFSPKPQALTCCRSFAISFGRAAARWSNGWDLRRGRALPIATHRGAPICRNMASVDPWCGH